MAKKPNPFAKKLKEGSAAEEKTESKAFEKKEDAGKGKFTPFKKGGKK
jgi:hypothetical protein